MYDENNNFESGLQPYDPIGMQPASTDWGRVAGIGLCVAGAAVCSVAVYKALFPSEAEQERAKAQQKLIDQQVRAAEARTRQAEAEATMAEREATALTQERVSAMKGYNLDVAKAQSITAAATIKAKLQELDNTDETMAMVQALLAGDGAAALKAQNAAKAAKSQSPDQASVKKALEALLATMS